MKKNHYLYLLLITFFSSAHSMTNNAWWLSWANPLNLPTDCNGVISFTFSETGILAFVCYQKTFTDSTNRFPNLMGAVVKFPEGTMIHQYRINNQMYQFYKHISTHPNEPYDIAFVDYGNLVMTNHHTTLHLWQIGRAHV